MSDNPKQGPGPAQTPGPENFAVLLAVTFGAHAVGAAALVALAGLVLGIPARRLLVPYLALLDLGVVFAVLVYWARLVRDRPKSYARRLGLAAFAYSSGFLMALGFSAVWLHLLPLDEAINIFGAFALPVPALAAGISYAAARDKVSGEKGWGSPRNFGVWLAATLAVFAVGNAVLVALVGLVLGMPARSLLVPYLALLDSSVVFAVLLYWARLVRDRPKSYALRFGLAVFAYSSCFLMALGFSAFWLHLVSLYEAINIFGAFALPVPALASGISYVAARLMVKGPQPG